MEPIRFSDVVFTDKNHVLYPGTQRVVDAGYFMGTYVPFNPSKLVYVQYDAKDLGVSFTCPENFVFTSVLGFRLTVSLRPQLYTEHPRVHTIYTNDFGEASQFRIERERIDRLGIESWESYIASFGPSEETVVVDGSAASKYVYPDSSGYGDHVIYFIKRGKYMYTISYENQINLTPEFDKILASIEFTEE
ncbi:hypothetical protein A3C87_00285 [Candidatus Kaiserbacteria bacterium RIFCSPHIGHO2_02_FULL_49_34]|uniref:Uncharacterized protein n=1 Tax=Candidatus Kaiserbacteria bacterium RIFCSPHIGHO2_02_FULL_49_34 TaxID=1798491 RepID=A0A1F6DK67_9BACT|nr:MAG: hypothetical protein A3C87_00285 [Candidatus Kaiserbacteria bacterium RIFCSPHIGHO2_02_FULL_49_34]